MVDKLQHIEFPGIHRFSARYLWRIRNYYLEYEDNTKLPPLVAGIRWSQNIIVMKKCKVDLEREFCIRMNRSEGEPKILRLEFSFVRQNTEL